MTISNVESNLDNIFTALSHQKRRAILHLLSLHPATVKQLAEANSLSLPSIHKHIRILEKGNLILRKKVGRTNFVVLGKSSLKIMQVWVKQYHTGWGNDRETLENYIAGNRD